MHASPPTSRVALIDEAPSDYQQAARTSAHIAVRSPTLREETTPSRVNKRASTLPDDSEAPKAKKPRASKAKNTGLPRKGTKRTDSVQDAINPYTPSPSDLVFHNNVSQTPKRAEEGVAWSGPMVKELQTARCMGQRYKADEFPRCVACTRRWAGDTCRFQHVRYFLRDNNQQIVATAFVEMHNATPPKMKYPTAWSSTMGKMEVELTKITVARALLPILQEEMDHVSSATTIYRPRETEARTTCDTCMTSIFALTWMCRVCGREACADCFAVVLEMTEEPQNATSSELAAWKAKKDAFYNRQPSFLQCTGRNREHRASQFSPVTRFCKEELESAVRDMGVLVADELAALKQLPPPVSGTEAPEEQVQPNDSSGIPYHEPRRFTKEELTNEKFRSIWARGEPFVVDDVLGGFQLQWTPQHFIEKYSSEDCVLIECQTDENKRTTVGQFFGMFGKYGEADRKRWKLKDFPPSTDFKSAFPELYEDFSNAVPVPDYVRRDGPLNLSSHFPINALAPDLGPKMYNAFASTTVPGSKGTTRLHMDMADAVNIMTYAEKAQNGEPGTAAWDLFKVEDSDKIREFLKKRTPSPNDPIHSQIHYLDDRLRKALWDEYRVKSYRVYQRPGQAVFIPAGCAHQVCNLADCIKIAIDFVSPENIDRCARLTKEFREQNKSRVWKEDVLQLRSMMWFAWVSSNLQGSKL